MSIVLGALFDDVRRENSGDDENILALLWAQTPDMKPSANDD